jgi:hypothetical protein
VGSFGLGFEEGREYFKYFVIGSNFKKGGEQNLSND